MKKENKNHYNTTFKPMIIPITIKKVMHMVIWHICSYISYITNNLSSDTKVFNMKFDSNQKS